MAANVVALRISKRGELAGENLINPTNAPRAAPYPRPGNPLPDQRGCSSTHPADPMPGGVIRGSGRRRQLAGVVLLLFAACTDAPSKPPGPVFPVTLKDFWTETESSTSPSGMVTFRVTNEGKTTHEFVVVRTNLPPDALPLGPNGLSVSEEAVEPLGELTEVPSGETLELVLPLEAGSYVFFCNLEGHYLSGMRDPLVVTDGQAPDPPVTEARETDEYYR